MAGSISGLHVFAADTGPEALSLLDTNYGLLTTAFNTLQNFSNSYIDSGAVNALIVTVPAPQVFSYSDGITLLVKVAATNTSTAPTINVNGLGAKTIINPDGSVLAAGQMPIGGWCTLRYEAGAGKFQLIGSPLGFSGTDVARLSLANTFTKANTVGGSTPDSPVILSSALPALSIVNTSAAANQKAWTLFATTTDLIWRVDNDAASVNAIFLDVVRSTNTVTSLTFGNATNNPAYSFAGTGLVKAGDQLGNQWDLGWRDCPQNLQTTNYQLVLADRGKQVFMNAAGLTLTIPANSGTAFPIGTTILICVGGGGALTVAITTDTLFLAGAGTTGSRTVSTFGMATLTKISATQWFIGGSGVS